MTIAVYLSRVVGLRVLLALLGLTALMQIIDVLDNTGTLLAAGEGVSGIAVYALWRVPAIVQQILPMAVLAGTLVSFFGLVRSNEIVAMRAVGVTSYRILACALPVAVAMAALHFALTNWAVPWTEPRFADWWKSVEAAAKAAEGKPAEESAPPRIWMRTADTVIAAAPGDSGRARMSDLTFMVLDPDGAVARRVEARSARFEDGTWTLHEVRDFQAREVGFAVTRTEALPWPVEVSPEEVLAGIAASRSLSIGRLLDVLRGSTPASASNAYYRTTLHHSFALLLTAPLMLLLSIPAAFGSVRHGGSGQGLLVGALLGVASLTFDGILTAMGEIGILPPALAAWTAPLAFVCIGGAILLRLEEP